ERYRAGLPLPLSRKQKQFFDRDLELTRQLERHFGVGHIGSGFNRVDGLPGNPHLPGELRGAHTSSLPNPSEIGLYAAHLLPQLSSWLRCKTIPPGRKGTKKHQSITKYVIVARQCRDNTTSVSTNMRHARCIGNILMLMVLA